MVRLQCPDLHLSPPVSAFLLQRANHLVGATSFPRVLVVPDTLLVVTRRAREREVPRISGISTVAQGHNVFDRGVRGTLHRHRELRIAVDALPNVNGRVAVPDVKRVVSGDDREDDLSSVLALRPLLLRLPLSLFVQSHPQMVLQLTNLLQRVLTSVKCRCLP